MNAPAFSPRSTRLRSVENLTSLMCSMTLSTEKAMTPITTPMIALYTHFSPSMVLYVLSVRPRRTSACTSLSGGS